jgi:adenylate cyclase
MFLSRFEQTSTIQLLLYAGIIVVLVSGIMQLHLFKKAEEITLDYRYQLLPRAELADTNVVIVAIDNESLESFADAGLPWPWSRDTYSFLIEVLNQAGVRAVMLDMLFYDADIDRFEVDSYLTDAAFARVLAENDNVVLATELLPVGTFDGNLPASVTFGRFGEDFMQNIPEFRSYRSPHPPFAESSSHIAAANVLPDAGGIIRQTWLGFNIGGYFVPSLALRTLYAAGEVQYFDENEIIVSDRTYFVSNGGRQRIFWYGNPGPDGVFRYISFAGIVDRGLNDPEALLFLRDKIVVVGGFASGLLDYKSTPMSGNDPYPGMEIWATVLSNFLQDHFVSEMPNWLHGLLLLLMAGGIVLYFRSFAVWTSVGLVLLATALYLSFVLLIWHWMLLAMPVISVLLTMTLGFSVATVISYVEEGSARKRLRSLFNRYLHPEVIDQLTRAPEDIVLGGRHMQATILFTDIANFTTYSEKKTPPELVSELNQYLSVITDMVLDEGGLLDKFTGDGIMALFGVPVPRENHASMACQMALRHLKYTKQVASGVISSQVGFFHDNTRIGINSGDIIAGNIGSANRMDYTAIGDDVNLAARLEGVNKVYGTSVIISEYTKLLIGDDFVCRELDSILVKGKDRPLRIFELLDHTKTAPNNSEWFTWVDTYERGLEMYRAGDFALAQGVFDELVRERGDTASQVMSDRCQSLQNQQPQNWDGVFKMTTK